MVGLGVKLVLASVAPIKRALVGLWKLAVADGTFHQVDATE